MNAGIIAIGDELLNGYTVDTNSSWISKFINLYGIKTVEKIIIGDSANKISKSLDLFLNNRKLDYIFVTGGLGPTHDDITKKTLSKYLNLPLVTDEAYLRILKNKFIKKNIEIPSNIKSQAQFLNKTTPIPNDEGTALGIYVKKNNTNIFVLPGVPSEVKVMFKKQIAKNYIQQKNIIKYIDLNTTGIYESKLYELLFDDIDNNSNLINVSFLPKITGVNIRLSLKNNSLNKDLLLSFKDKIKQKIKKYIYSDKGETLEEVVVNELIKRKTKLSIAESCSGGLISKKITDVPGASRIFLGGVVAYSNKFKIDNLNVQKKSIEKYGAVSKEVAIEMVENIMKITKSNIAIATTGVSGPDGGSNNKPVGLVYIALKNKNKIDVKKFNLIPKRKLHREQVSCIALNMIRLSLIEK